MCEGTVGERGGRGEGRVVRTNGVKLQIKDSFEALWLYTPIIPTLGRLK
jgi:hypothetical protein